MFSHLYTANKAYLPFSAYIDRCRELITSRRRDLQGRPDYAKLVIEANTPFELKPAQTTKIGALLIHGLLNCPFAMKDVGLALQSQGVLTRSILLPGHGTRPDDLLQITYQDWIDAVQYGIHSLRQEVDQVLLVGYSAGATLGVHQALMDSQIAGLILLAPAIKIKAPVDLLINWRRLTHYLTKNYQWLCREHEIDYAKYQSIPFNAATQVALLSREISKITATQSISCPIFMTISDEDETVSSHTATQFFKKMPHQTSELLLYSANNPSIDDPRVLVRAAKNNDLHIKDLSHLSLLFSADNPHYGSQGDYIYASHPAKKNILYGAYNTLVLDMYNLMYQVGLTKIKRQELTYNPDFDFMVGRMASFVTSLRGS